MKKYISLILIIVSVLLLSAVAVADDIRTIFYVTVNAGEGGQVRCDLNGHIGSSLTEGYYDGDTAVFTAIANNGYHFSHWEDGSTNPQLSVSVSANYTAYFESDTASVSSDEESKSEATTNTRTIFYVTVNAGEGGQVRCDLNGHIGSSLTEGYYDGDTAVFTAIANNGYHFSHWEGGSTNPQLSVSVSANYTAYFESDTSSGLIVITYYDDAGVVQGQDTKQTNERYTIASAKCLKKDYIQIKWQSSSGKLYNFGSIYDGQESLNLYPYWQSNSAPLPYPSLFDDTDIGSSGSSNSSSGSDASSDYSGYAVITYYDDAGVLQGQDTKQPNERYYIASAKCLKKDYTQIKWQTKSGTLYNFGSKYDGNGSLDLYPYWEKSSVPMPSIYSTYKITFYTYDGILSPGYPCTYTYGQAYILPDFSHITRNGYTFGGWYCDPSFSGIPVSRISPFEFGDKTFYAKWIPHGCAKYITVSYSNHGTVYLGNKQVSNGAQFLVQPGYPLTFTFSPENLYYVYNVKVGGRNLGTCNNYTISYESMSGNKDMYVSFGSIYGAPKTGDDSDLVLWTVLGLSAMLCSGAAIFVLKKKEG